MLATITPYLFILERVLKSEVMMPLFILRVVMSTTRLEWWEGGSTCSSLDVRLEPGLELLRSCLKIDLTVRRYINIYLLG